MLNVRYMSVITLHSRVFHKLTVSVSFSEQLATRSETNQCLEAQVADLQTQNTTKLNRLTNLEDNIHQLNAEISALRARESGLNENVSSDNVL